jgi:Na+-transporting NADH:ubiquinone oxidoreductase subunit NqrB
LLVLGALLGYGLVSRVLPNPATIALVSVAIALLCEGVFARLFSRSPSWPSAAISGISLALLLRTDEPLVAGGAAGLAIAGKYLLRIKGRHLFNPSALALVVIVGLSDAAWISPGLWGQGSWLAVALFAAGCWVTNGARRLDSALAFLFGWLLVELLWRVWLGDPMAIALHRLQSIALLVFAFYMITDPRTTPHSSRGRIVHAMLVALLAQWLNLSLYLNTHLYLALVLLAPLPLLLNLRDSR